MGFNRKMRRKKRVKKDMAIGIQYNKLGLVVSFSCPVGTPDIYLDEPMTLSEFQKNFEKMISGEVKGVKIEGWNYENKHKLISDS